MARKKTAPFYLTTLLEMDSTTSVQTTAIDLSSYVDPADKQGIEILQVDFIFHDSSNRLPIVTSTDFVAAVMLKDNSQGDLVPFDDIHLVASAGLSHAGIGLETMVSDIWPDRFGISGTTGRICINDSLEIVGKMSASIADVQVAIRVLCQVVTLTQKDYMTLALQSVADS